MLLNLHVKNLALIDEADVYFDKGLNILTGETGAGKSIIVGSIQLALGARVPKEMIRKDCEYALVELVFQIEDEYVREKLIAMDVFPEDDQVILSRKIMGNRSVAKLNGETVTAGVLKQVGEILIDMHSQHEHQSLVNPGKQLEILDEFAKKQLEKDQKLLKEEYHRYLELKKRELEFSLDAEQRTREISFLQFEISEIEEANLQVGEDDKMEEEYKTLLHSGKITDICGRIYEETGYTQSGGIGETIGRAVKEVQSIENYDSRIKGLASQLQDIDSLLNDFNRELSEYLAGLEFQPDEFSKIEDRLDLLNRLKSKYGSTIELILESKKEKEEKLETLLDYESHKEVVKKEKQDCEEIMIQLSNRIFEVRKKQGKLLEKQIREALIDLNFLDVKFEIGFEKIEGFTEKGQDRISFLISTNPGEPLMQLQKVASGGELSRIMLAIKTILADKDEHKALVFDEIDVGISGRTAQKVSEKLAVIAQNHQVICITHLAQIAAMSDAHYIIEKEVKNKKTVTSIEKLKETEIVQELARILGGAEITENVMSSAKEMRELAKNKKN